MSAKTKKDLSAEIRAAQREKAISVRTARQSRRDPILAAVIRARDELAAKVAELEKALGKLKEPSSEKAADKPKKNEK